MTTLLVRSEAQTFLTEKLVTQYFLGVGNIGRKIFK